MNKDNKKKIDFQNKVISFTRDMDCDSDETSFNEAVEKVLNAYSGECSVEFHFSTYLNVRGSECRTVVFIIRNKHRQRMDQYSGETMARFPLPDDLKVEIDYKAVEAVYDAIGLNYTIDSLDPELSEDLEEFCIFNNLIKMETVVSLQDLIPQLWQDWQSK